jgi:hypothetical protein
MILEKRNTLYRQIAKLFAIQDRYMHGVVAYRDTATNSEGRESLKDERPELIKLWLPSAIPANTRSSYCFPGILDIYTRYRQSQVHDTLVLLRQARKMVKAVRDKYKYQIAGTGQRATTRARTTIAAAAKRSTKVARRYCVARSALLALDPTGDWQKTYQHLDLQKDVRGPGRDPEEAPQGDGDYVQSWIWMGRLGKNFQDTTIMNTSTPEPANLLSTTANVPDPSVLSAKDSVYLNETLRVEWSRLTARADRWTEEYDLLIQEMQRTLAYLQWKSDDWKSRTSLRATTVPSQLRAGLAAYASKQAFIHHELAISFANQWHAILSKHGVVTDWFDSTGALQNLYSRFNPPEPPEPPTLPDLRTPITCGPETQDLDDDDDDDDEVIEDDEDEDLDWEDEDQGSVCSADELDVD